jgi:hypothetical protein
MLPSLEHRYEPRDASGGAGLLSSHRRIGLCAGTPRAAQNVPHEMFRRRSCAHHALDLARMAMR